MRTAPRVLAIEAHDRHTGEREMPGFSSKRALIDGVGLMWRCHLAAARPETCMAKATDPRPRPRM